MSQPPVIGGTPPIVLSQLTDQSHNSYLRAQAVVAALELVRAKCLGGTNTKIADLTANVSKMADEIQEALELKDQS